MVSHFRLYMYLMVGLVFAFTNGTDGCGFGFCGVYRSLQNPCNTDCINFHIWKLVCTCSSIVGLIHGG